MKPSERWAQRANAYGLHGKDKRLALLCFDAVIDLAKLEAELDMYERDETFGTLAIRLVKLEEENKALSVLLSDLVDVELERDALKNELAYRKEADCKVLAEDCGADEKHCTCAPALYRRIAELEAAFDDAVRALWECEIEHVLQHT